VAISRLDRAARTVWQVRPGERLEFQAVGMVGGEMPSQRDLLSCMKHPPLDSAGACALLTSLALCLLSAE